MAKKDNTRERTALKIMAMQQRQDQLEDDIKWIKRELRKLPVRMFREDEAP